MNIRKWCVLTGAFFIMMTTNLPNLWGNISIYVVSYFEREGISASGLKSPWVYSLSQIGLIIGVNVSGFLKSYSTKLIVFTAIIVFNVSFISCYFALKYVAMPLIFGAFFLCGACIGIFDGTLFKWITDWPESDKGFLISVATSGIHFSPCVVNYFVGAYVNLDNLKPDSVNDEDIFLQKSIIEKVPSMFAILGVGFLSLQIIGFCLICLKKIKSTPVNGFLSTKESQIYGSGTEQHVMQNLDYDETTRHANSFNGGNEDSYQEVASRFGDDKDNIILENQSKANDEIFSENDRENTEFTPCQTLRCSSFYVLWVACGCWVAPTILIYNFYKTFGLKWIKDDHFLTFVGSVMEVASGVTLVLWGCLVDRIKMKNCWMIIKTCLAISTLLMYFTAALDKWLYLISTGILCCCANIAFATFITAIMVYFGEENFASNWGLLSSATMVFNFVFPPTFDLLLTNFGWFSLFGCATSVLIFALILIMLILPHK